MSNIPDPNTVFPTEYTDGGTGRNQKNVGRVTNTNWFF